MNRYTLQRIFDDLHLGDLSQVNLGGSDSDCEDLDTIARQRITSFINFGLTELYTRFPLSEREVVIKLYSDITEYFLDSAYAETNYESEQPIKYILDTPSNKFTNDVLRIEGCYGSSGEEYLLNTEGSKRSVYTPSYASVQVPEHIVENTLFLIYRAKHADIEYSAEVDATKVMVNIPSYLYDALLQYVTYRVFKMRATPEARAITLQNFQLFNNICAEVERRNLTNNGFSSTYSQLDNNGWS